MTEIWTYSLPQLYSFLVLAIRHRRDLKATEAMHMRAAYHADGKEFNQFIDTE